MVPPTVGWTLLHQLVISTSPTDTPTGQTDLGHPSLGVPSQMTVGCVMVTVKADQDTELKE